MKFSHVQLFSKHAKQIFRNSTGSKYQRRFNKIVGFFSPERVVGDPRWSKMSERWPSFESLLKNNCVDLKTASEMSIRMYMNNYRLFFRLKSIEISFFLCVWHLSGLCHFQWIFIGLIDFAPLFDWPCCINFMCFSMM